MTRVILTIIFSIVSSLVSLSITDATSPNGHPLMFEIRAKIMHAKRHRLEEAYSISIYELKIELLNS